MPESELFDKMRSLNSQQYEFLMDLLHHIKTKDDPLPWIFLSGDAGVGKTRTTNMYFQCLLHILRSEAGINPEEICILKMASIGKAAFLIRGNTIHSALAIPINQKKSFTSLLAFQNERHQVCYH